MFILRNSVEPSTFSLDKAEMAAGGSTLPSAYPPVYILSTVRNTKVGNIGFLDFGGRANVALTRARYITFFLFAKELPLDPLKIYLPVHFYLNKLFSPQGLSLDSWK